jgi:hypothetical protein
MDEAEPLTVWLMTPDAPELEHILNRPDWHALAECRGTGPAQFITDAKEPPDDVLALCRRCLVREECLTRWRDESLEGTCRQPITSPGLVGGVLVAHPSDVPWISW